MKRLTGFGLLLLLGLALGAWLGPTVLALHHLDAGDRAMIRAKAFLAAHPTAYNEDLDQAVRHFVRATQLTPEDGHVYRRLGQAWLLAGNNQLAREALSRAAELRPRDPMVHLELGYAWDGLGQAEQAVAEYERGRYGPAIEEALVNYLKLADWHIAAQGGDLALEILKTKVLALDPDNLPGLYRLATLYEGMSEDGAEFAQPIRMRMKQFSEKSVAVPSEPRLADYLAQTMIALTEDGTWARETLLNVAAFQVWRYSEGESGLGTERVMLSLVEHWPEDADFRFQLGEFYARRGDTDRAEATYRPVLARDPEYALASLRLGMMSEARGGEGLRDAAAWYERYHEALPDDLLGLKKLAGVYAALARPEAASLREELEAVTDDRRTVARQMGVPVEQVELGPNLLENGGFEIWEADDTPGGWIASHMFNREPFGAAFFVPGTDKWLPWDGYSGVRIAGLWQDQQSGQSRPRAGFWAWDDEKQSLREIPVQAGEWYMISLTYQSPDDLLSMWVAEKRGVLFEADHFLPSTHGQVRHYVALFQSQDGGSLRPLIRYWGTGSVWFDGVAIRKVLDGH